MVRSRSPVLSCPPPWSYWHPFARLKVARTRRRRQGGRCEASGLGALLLACVGCAMPYAYSFHVENPDARLRGQAQPRGRAGRRRCAGGDSRRPTGARAHPAGPDQQDRPSAPVEVATNHHDRFRRKLGLRCARMSMWAGFSRGPPCARGWFPFALPPSGDRAAVTKAATSSCLVPMIVRREPKLYRYSFAVDVRRSK